MRLINRIASIYEKVIYFVGAVFFWGLLLVVLFGGGINFNMAEGLFVKLLKLFG